MTIYGAEQVDWKYGPRQRAQHKDTWKLERIYAWWSVCNVLCVCVRDSTIVATASISASLVQHKCSLSVYVCVCVCPLCAWLRVSLISCIGFVASVWRPTFMEIYHSVIVNAVTFYLSTPTRLMEMGGRTAFHVIRKTWYGRDLRLHWNCA